MGFLPWANQAQSQASNVLIDPAAPVFFLLASNSLQVTISIG